MVDPVNLLGFSMMNDSFICIELLKTAHPRSGEVVCDGGASGEINAKSDREQVEKWEGMKEERDKRKERQKNEFLSHNL